jgi:hypothetical protein
VLLKDLIVFYDDIPNEPALTKPWTAIKEYFLAPLAFVLIQSNKND